MKKINFNQFLQTTILENSTIEPNEFDLTFAELICGKNSKTYKQTYAKYDRMFKEGKAECINLAIRETKAAMETVSRAEALNTGKGEEKGAEPEMK